MAEIDETIANAANGPQSVNITPGGTSVTQFNPKDLIEVAKYQKAQAAMEDDEAWPLKTVLIIPPGAVQ